MRIIRAENEVDFKNVRAMHLRAFEEDSPGALVDDLRNSNHSVISLVCEETGEIVGHVLFSRIEAPFRALTMAPVGVCPQFQKTGIGSNLIRKGLELAGQDAWQVVFVLGDPAYYERFGFTADAAKDYTSPYKGSANMALLLDQAAPKTGVLVFPPAFDEDIAEHQAEGIESNSLL